MTTGRRVVSRRSLLLGLLATAGGVMAGTHHWRRLRQPAAGDVAALIYDRLNHLPLDPAGVDRFAREYVARYGAFAASVHHRRTLGGTFRIDAVRRLLPQERQQALLSFERKLISYYLRSTDYFQTTRPREVRYVAFADPYEVGCANPLAVLEL
jgi:hypothetical protein